MTTIKTKSQPAWQTHEWNTREITSKKTTGHHMLGAERSIKPESGRVRLDAHDGELSAQVIVSGPVDEHGLQGRKGYWAGGSYNDFEGVSLPLEEGKVWKNREGDLATYRDGKLVIESSARLSELSTAGGLALAPFEVMANVFEQLDPALGRLGEALAGRVEAAVDKNFSNHVKVEIEVSGDLKTVGGITFSEQRTPVSDRGWPKGEPVTLNDFSLSQLKKTQTR